MRYRKRSDKRKGDYVSMCCGGVMKGYFPFISRHFFRFHIYGRVKHRHCNFDIKATCNCEFMLFFIILIQLFKCSMLKQHVVGTYIACLMGALNINIITHTDNPSFNHVDYRKSCNRCKYML